MMKQKNRSHAVFFYILHSFCFVFLSASFKIYFQLTFTFRI